MRGIANENHGGTHRQTLLPEMPWVHSYAQDAFALFLQFSRDKMDDHVEEGSVEEEEDEGSGSSFFARGWRFFMSDVVGFFCDCAVLRALNW